MHIILKPKIALSIEGVLLKCGLLIKSGKILIINYKNI